MTASAQTAPGSYELPLPPEPAAPPTGRGQAAGALPDSLLTDNVFWFCRLRWIVVGILTVFGAMSHLWPGLLGQLGMRTGVRWPFAVAAVLALANLAFLAHGRSLARRPRPRGVKANLWVHICFDLVLLTAVVHFAGSLQTHAAFAYLFHIVLACIFFSRGQSLAVVAVATGLFGACVTLERAGVLSPASVLAGGAAPAGAGPAGQSLWLNTVSPVAIWLVVWYLASHLSTLLRMRDSELAETNRRLLEAREERARHVLRTTHELKAPFAAVHANAQLLLRGDCGELTDRARQVVERIARRCAMLATEIQEMLQLANLRSSTEQPRAWENLRLDAVIRWAVDQVQQTAQERHVVLQTELEPARIIGIEEHLRMMFLNLLSNAVVYSRPGGRVRVSCSEAGRSGPVAVVQDHGIGIVPEKLPRIFDEYYRTEEAARCNTESTGLGLAIVRQVAQAHRIGVHVESAPGAGTSFVLRFGSHGKAQ